MGIKNLQYVDFKYDKNTSEGGKSSSRLAVNKAKSELPHLSFAWTPLCLPWTLSVKVLHGTDGQTWTNWRRVSRFRGELCSLGSHFPFMRVTLPQDSRDPGLSWPSLVSPVGGDVFCRSDITCPVIMAPTPYFILYLYVEYYLNNSFKGKILFKLISYWHVFPTNRYWKYTLDQIILDQ